MRVCTSRGRSPSHCRAGCGYELQHAGVRQDYLDVLVSRDFASSAAAVATPFDDGWFGYGRVSPPAPPKAARLRPNCGNARVVQETDNGKKDDAKPHFGTKAPADDDKPKANSSKTATPDPCHDDTDKPDRVSLADERDKNAPDPERPTLHRSPETTANNTGAVGKPDKKPNKPPPATITANGSPADDPDRPTIRHRATDENDPNALPPDPIDLASHERTQAVAKATQASDTEVPPHAAATVATGNDTVADNASISSGGHHDRPAGVASGTAHSPTAGTCTGYRGKACRGQIFDRRNCKARCRSEDDSRRIGLVHRTTARRDCCRQRCERPRSARLQLPLQLADRASRGPRHAADVGARRTRKSSARNRCSRGRTEGCYCHSTRTENPGTDDDRSTQRNSSACFECSSQHGCHSRARTRDGIYASRSACLGRRAVERLPALLQCAGHLHLLGPHARLGSCA